MKKMSIITFLILMLTYDLVASERERTSRPSVPLSRFITPTLESIEQLEKQVTLLTATKGDTDKNEYFRLAKLATAYSKLRDNYRGREQGTIYRKYDELHQQANRASIILNDKITLKEQEEALLKEQIECLNAHAKAVMDDKSLKVTQRCAQAQQLYAQIIRLSEHTFPTFHQGAIDKLKFIDNLKFQDEIINLIRDCHASHNKTGMITHYKILRSTVVDHAHIRKIDTAIATLENEMAIEHKIYDFENTTHAMLNDNDAPLQCYQNVVTYCQKWSQDPDLKAVCDEKQQFFQAAADAEQRHIDRLTRIKTELARTPEDIVKDVLVACKITPYAVGLKATTDQVEMVKTGTFATEEERQVALANALHARSTFYYQYPATHTIDALKDKQQAEDIALGLVNKCSSELFAQLSFEIESYRLNLKLIQDKVEAIKVGTFATEQEKQVALANALYERAVFYNTYPEKHVQAAQEDKKHYEDIVYLLIGDNCPMLDKLNPAINPLAIK